jgi:two-component system sensor histidine kinase UhpB
MLPEIIARPKNGRNGARESERIMSLRMRLTALVGLVLLLSVAGGGALVAWRAARSVQTELRAALDVGAQTVRNGFADLAETNEPGKELRRLVATFDGDRHVRASLVDTLGHVSAVSTLFPPTQQVPGWFVRLIVSEPPGIRLPVPTDVGGGGAVVLHAVPVNEAGEVWAQSLDAMLVLGGFATISALLISLAVARALRPLATLSTAFEHIGQGEYHGVLPAKGSPEVMRVVVGFNRMTEQLAAADAQNHRLNERLMTLQAEERADLARDLHDEVGPLLFAVDMTAAAIERLPGGSEAAIATHVRSIHEAVARMQRHVRVILGRLRPIQAIGLQAAIERLANFWGSRRPDIGFDIAVAVEEDRVGNELRETIYRVVQESMSNAIRHGRPTRVSIVVDHEPHDDGVRVEVSDDGVGMTASVAVGRGSARLGLVGMRERVMAMAGSLTITPGRDGKGCSVVVRLPCEAVPTEQADARE